MLLTVMTGSAISGAPAPPSAPSVENIADTKHNFSVTQPVNSKTVRNIASTAGGGTSEICIFCHTPHGANAKAASFRAPIWNRHLSQASYKLYDQVWSFSFEGEMNIGAPTGYSRLCLSCHDGTIAIGSVVNGPGSGGTNTEFQMEYPTNQQPAGIAGTIPVGSGVLTGDTRVIGTDLRNDHPVSFIYDSQLARLDTELVDPGVKPPDRMGDPTPISPLRRAEGNLKGVFDSVQCTSCHNPHGVKYPKFLRAGLYQNEPPGSQIICLSCHDKAGWKGSTHDISQAVHNPYPTVENPYDYDGKHTVSQYACRNCHDPHTAQGAKKLHREGIDNTGTIDAIENTCFLCHSKEGTSLPAGRNTGFVDNPGVRVAPDIASQFAKDRNVGGECSEPEGPQCGSAMNVQFSQGHKTVFISRSQEGVELLSPSPPLNNESAPGINRVDNAHIECVDCHNPHQVTPENRLKGTKGIDIDGNVVGKGVAGNDREPYVYEVCFRCHGNSYVNIFMGARFPDDTFGVELRSHPRQLPANRNFSMIGFSNKRREFDPSSTNPALFSWSSSNTAYHPVAGPGRNGSPQLCWQLSVAFKLDCSDPEAALSSLTIQCTDCHNSDKTGGANLGPVTESNLRVTDKPYYNGNGKVQTKFFLNVRPSLPPGDRAIGPHGSRNIRILRNRYQTDIKHDLPLFGNRCFETKPSKRPIGGCLNSSVSDGAFSTHFNNFLLCFICHQRTAFDPYMAGTTKNHKVTRFFGTKVPFSQSSAGFIDNWSDNLHMYHLRYSGAYCHECHNNVHSNIEAQNTLYLPTGVLPPSGTDGMAKDNVVGTHLINFGPQADGSIYNKPAWVYESNGRFRCYLFCHGNNMNNCAYRGFGTHGGTPGNNWCAGGSSRG